MSTMSAEPSRHRHNLPPGYAFVPKGNVYITGNCRKSTQAIQQTVYAVTSAKKQRIGIGVPFHIHELVKRQEAETRGDRAVNVQKHDASIEKALRSTILDEFPNIPAAELPNLLKIALEKRKGKVGRTGKLDVRNKAQLAVRAYIRHRHTPYDQHMKKDNMPRWKARASVLSLVDATAQAWSGKPFQSTAWKFPERILLKSRKVRSAVVKKRATRKRVSNPHMNLPARNDKAEKQPVETIDLTMEDLPLIQNSKPSSATRSMCQISETLSSLSQRLPKSLEPEPCSSTRSWTPLSDDDIF